MFQDLFEHKPCEMPREPKDEGETYLQKEKTLESVGHVEMNSETASKFEQSSNNGAQLQVVGLGCKLLLS